EGLPVFRRHGRREPRGQAKVTLFDGAPFGQNDRPLETIAKLPNIARPTIGSQAFASGRIEPERFLLELLRQTLEAPIDERIDVLGRLPQWRNVDRKNPDAIVEIFAKEILRR